MARVPLVNETDNPELAVLIAKIRGPLGSTSDGAGDGF